MTPDSAATGPLVAVVDDEEDITTFLGLVLVDNGYRVLTLNKANVAMDALRRERPDLICLDLLMPHVTGASLYKEIRSDGALERTPVLILSGLAAQQDLNELLRRDGGAHPPEGYLEKPVKTDAFLELVAKLLPGEGGDEGADGRDA